MSEKQPRTEPPPYKRDPKTGRFLNGNCGKQPGTKNRFRNVFSKRMDAMAEEITEKVLEAVRNGDSSILGKFARYGLAKAQVNVIKGIDGDNPGKAVMRALAEGRISAQEAGELGKIISVHQQEQQITELKERLDRLDQRGI